MIGGNISHVDHNSIFVLVDALHIAWDSTRVCVGGYQIAWNSFSISYVIWRGTLNSFGVCVESQNITCDSAMVRIYIH